MRRLVEKYPRLTQGEVELAEFVLMELLRLEVIDLNEEPIRDESLPEGQYSWSYSDFERRYFKDLLKKNNGNVTFSAVTSGLCRATIYRKIKEYGLELIRITDMNKE